MLGGTRPERRTGDSRSRMRRSCCEASGPVEVLGLPIFSRESSVINGTESGGMKDVGDRATADGGAWEADGFLRDLFSRDGWQPIEGNKTSSYTEREGQRRKYRTQAHLLLPA